MIRYTDNKKVVNLFILLMGVLILHPGCISSLITENQVVVDSIADKWVPGLRSVA